MAFESADKRVQLESSSGVELGTAGNPVITNRAAASNYAGTVGAAVPTVAALVGGTDGTNLQALKAPAGVLSVSSSATATLGAATPAVGTLVAGTDGTNLQGLKAPQGVLSVSTGGQTTGVVAAAAASTIVKASAGRLARVLVTAAGTAVLTFYDNAAGTATGTVLGVVKATAVVGDIYDLQFPAAVGISAIGGAGSPAVTVSFV